MVESRCRAVWVARKYKKRAPVHIYFQKYVGGFPDLPIFTAYLPFASNATWAFLVLLELLRGALTCLSSTWGGAKTFGRGGGDGGISEASIILMNIFNLRLH